MQRFSLLLVLSLKICSHVAESKIPTLKQITSDPGLTILQWLLIINEMKSILLTLACEALSDRTLVCFPTLYRSFPGLAQFPHFETYLFQAAAHSVPSPWVTGLFSLEKSKIPVPSPSEFTSSLLQWDVPCLPTQVYSLALMVILGPYFITVLKTCFASFPD